MRERGIAERDIGFVRFLNGGNTILKSSYFHAVARMPFPFSTYTNISAPFSSIILFHRILNVNF
jgi:hypothetical protein